jgi:hypothetical protein
VFTIGSHRFVPPAREPAREKQQFAAAVEPLGSAPVRRSKTRSSALASYKPSRKCLSSSKKSFRRVCGPRATCGSWDQQIGLLICRVDDTVASCVSLVLYSMAASTGVRVRLRIAGVLRPICRSCEPHRRSNSVENDARMEHRLLHALAAFVCRAVYEIRLLGSPIR